MPTQPYKNKDGIRVPGTTTIIGRAKHDAGGLIHWAYECGLKGIDYREARDSAASIGSIAHDMVEAHIKGTNINLDGHRTDWVVKAKKSFKAFIEWANASELKADATEIPLVSEQYQYGGCPDVIFVKGKRSLGDWKTSSNVYADYLLQLAAYKNLWEENYPNKPIEGGAHLIRFDKEYGDFHHHYYSDLDDAWEAFKCERQLYNLMKKLKKRVQ